MRIVDRSPKLGDERVVHYYAFIPVTIGRERRCFEYVYVLQYWSGVMWTNFEFLDPSHKVIDEKQLLRPVDAEEWRPLSIPPQVQQNVIAMQPFEKEIEKKSNP